MKVTWKHDLQKGNVYFRENIHVKRNVYSNSKLTHSKFISNVCLPLFIEFV